MNSLLDPGNGVCDSTECTLRESIAAAKATTGSDTILFDVGTTGTITLDSQLVVDFNGLQIVDPEPDKITVSGNNLVRVFRMVMVVVVMGQAPVKQLRNICSIFVC